MSEGKVLSNELMKRIDQNRNVVASIVTVNCCAESILTNTQHDIFSISFFRISIGSRSMNSNATIPIGLLAFHIGRHSHPVDVVPRLNNLPYRANCLRNRFPVDEPRIKEHRQTGSESNKSTHIRGPTFIASGAGFQFMVLRIEVVGLVKATHPIIKGSRSCKRSRRM